MTEPNPTYVYVYVIDLGLNGHDVIEASAVERDPGDVLAEWRAELAAAGQLVPYNLGVSRWKITVGSPAEPFHVDQDDHA